MNASCRRTDHSKDRKAEVGEMTEATIHQMLGGQAGDGRVVAVDLRQAEPAHLIVQVDGRHAGLRAACEHSGGLMHER